MSNSISSTLPELAAPYVIFLGDVRDDLLLKTGAGIKQWRGDLCAGQVRLISDAASLGLPDLTIDEAANQGAGSLILGAALVGGTIKESWMPSLLEAISRGLDIVAGLHSRLNDNPVLVEAARRHNVRLIDVRVPPRNIPVGTGQKRQGKRLLTVGTDCAVGKKYTALALEREMRARGIPATFRATGQTGIMIAGRGIPMDAVVSDFIAGAAEVLSPANDASHWDVIEGQGSLFHPGYAAVSLGLLHGSQPDAIVVCHDPLRQVIHEYSDFPIPSLAQCIERNLELGRLTNPNIRCVGISLNTSAMEPHERDACMAAVRAETGLPCVDPLSGGVGAIVDHIDMLTIG